MGALYVAICEYSSFGMNLQHSRRFIMFSNCGREGVIRVQESETCFVEREEKNVEDLKKLKKKKKKKKKNWNFVVTRSRSAKLVCMQKH